MRPEIDTARYFQCDRCRAQVFICAHCDRGNHYCPTCAPIAHQEAVRRASKRYQATRKGQFNHAEREKRYRHGNHPKEQFVTHMGSSTPESHDLLAPTHLETTFLEPSEAEQYSCHFCKKMCSKFLRVDFFRSAFSKKPPGLFEEP